MTLKSSFYNLTKINSMTSWRVEGKNRLVKVLPAAESVRERIGYVTQERYLIGLTPLQIERDLGLKPKMLVAGCKVYALQRLPRLDEFECKLSTLFPGGAVFDWDDVSDEQFQVRDFWPPGSGFPQWDVGVSIPVSMIRSLMPYEPY